MRFITALCILISTMSCNQHTNRDKTNHLQIGSKWTFIQNHDSSVVNYAEIAFNDNSTLNIFSESNGHVGPFEYDITDNILRFNNNRFSIVPMKNGSIILKNKSSNYILFQIPFDETRLTSNQIDPFYIRRCYYLVNLGYITSDEAIAYLSSIAVINDSLQEDIFLVH